MRLIVLDDANYFRRLAVESLFANFFPRDNHVVVMSIEEAKELLMMYCRRYREVVVIGTPSCLTVKDMVRHCRNVNQGMRLRFFLFSDMLGLPQLNKHLVVSDSVIFLAADISRESLIHFLERRNTLQLDGCVAVKFNGNDESVIALWRRELSHNLPYSRMTTRDYNHSRILKNRLDIYNEYALCLLWHFVCCAVQDYQWEVPYRSRLPGCRYRQGGREHPLIQSTPVPRLHP